MAGVATEPCEAATTASVFDTVGSSCFDEGGDTGGRWRGTGEGDELLVRFPVFVFATVVLPVSLTSPTAPLCGVIGRGVAISKMRVMAKLDGGDGAAAIIDDDDEDEDIVC